MVTRSGTLQALGVTSASRWDSLPDIPVIAETAPGHEVSVWYGIFAPKKTPPQLVASLNSALSVALADSKVKARFAEGGGVPMPMTPGELGKFTADDTEKWRKVVEFAVVSAD
jgi:tripartite-type tricarboxylate transporter receptor subunit TctC